jgi:hypothetical protein
MCSEVVVVLDKQEDKVVVVLDKQDKFMLMMVRGKSVVLKTEQYTYRTII